MGKITDYTELTTPVDSINDFFVMVDVSDTSMSPQGTTKKVNPFSAAPYAVVVPSGSTGGTTDTTNINAAISALQAAGNGGTVFLAPGKFYITASANNAAITLPAQTTSGSTGGIPINLIGSGWGTIVYVVDGGAANVTGIYCHRTNSYGGQFGLADPFDQPCSMIKDFMINGNLATGNGTIGLDWGDGLGFDIKLHVRNFNGTNQIGVQQINRIFWTEKNDVRLELYNNSQGLVITNTQNIGPSTAAHSVEYNDYWLTLWLEAGQHGVDILHGSNAGGSKFWFRGNCSSLPVGQTTGGCGFGVFTITGDDGTGAGIQNDEFSRIYGGHLEGKIEGNDGNGQGGGVYPPFLFTGTSAHNGLIQVTGGILHSVGNSNITNSTITFNGGIGGDTTLSAARSTW